MTRPSSKLVRTTGTAPWAIPGLEVSSSGGDGAASFAERASTNRWLVSIGAGARTSLDHAARLDPSPPSRVLDEVAGLVTGDLVQLSVEHDVCGAWVTLANAGPCRPIVVRRAGWVDLRGHPSPPLGTGFVGYCDDRVGLGPGDALVLVPRHALATRRLDAAAAAAGDEQLLDATLAAAIDPAVDARGVALACASPSATAAPVVVLRVPIDLGADRHARLAALLGVAKDDLQLPGYPLGDLQPELWSRPPAPPRIARLLLPPDLAHVREVRSLLRRMLSSWRISDLVDADDLELLATETATNAVRHTGSDATVTMRYDGDAVRVCVADRSTELPALLPPDPRRAGGRGMYLVDTLASAWGAAPSSKGKDVWFEVPVVAAD